MTFDDLGKALSKFRLVLCWDVNKDMISVGKREFSNPLLWFDPRTEEKDYTGSVTVKSINVGLYSSEEVYVALNLVNSFLLTDLAQRNI